MHSDELPEIRERQLAIVSRGGCYVLCYFNRTMVASYTDISMFHQGPPNCIHLLHCSLHSEFFQLYSFLGSTHAVS